MITIPDLPLEDYQLLAKFQNLKSIQFYKEGRSGATDIKLESIAALGFSNLRDIETVAAQNVTDKGIAGLARVSSLKFLSLEGTSITDAACAVLASKMHLEGVNVANCSQVTVKGLLSLARSRSLKEISLSVDKLTQADILHLISEFKSITWCQIVDPDERLDKQAIRESGKEKGIKVVLKRTGALQDLGNSP